MSSIGETIAERGKVWVHCTPCGRSVNLDLEALAEKLGRDHSVLHKDLVPKLKCSACGSKKLTLSLIPDYNRPGPGFDTQGRLMSLALKAEPGGET